MSTTVASVLADARNMLMGTMHDVYNTVAVISSTSTTSVTFQTSTASQLPVAGSYFEVDLEVMYVQSMSGAVATVIRGMLGTTAATHSAGALARIDPTFFDSYLFYNLQGELADLTAPGNGLFQVKSVDITYNAANIGYDLTSTTTVDNVLDVRYRQSDSTRSWPRPDFELIRNAYTTDFASGNAILIKNGGQPGQIVRVWYKAPYGTITAVTDTLETTAGMHDEAVDIPALGIAINVAAGREIMRNDYQSQGSSRRAAEVPAGANTAAPSGIRQLHKDRVEKEAGRLAARWPGFARFT